ncbi:MAG: efflux transporter outer membrane subunit [Bacteroidetes bacterium]|uniref:Efflux transporter outer membrane subunit n=1 Tax=Candidatus Cryptobacteroides merdigallinarum TaxID=2840770 RepID=A0A9D9EJX7_9BACT|nr:efflux transporter outer membrane subunit [Candidatus Cryptobacteroides merdigallinarum]
MSRHKNKKTPSGGGSAATIITAVLVAGTLTISCSPAKHCAAPELDIPETYGSGSPADTVTWADLEWWKIYQDTTLQKLIKDALEYNKDMLVAAERLREMEYRYRIERSRLWPSVSARVYGEDEYTNYDGHSGAHDPAYSAIARFSWEIDLWGHLRWGSKERLAEYFASVEARRALRLSLIAEVANAYFDLQALDNELLIVKRTLQTREEGVQKAWLRLDGGLTSEIPYQQALVERATTASLVPDLERQIATKESELSFLTGSYPTRIERERVPLELSYRRRIPVGIPSQLLSRRPDLRQAEQELKAAEAAVGVAQAERFPTFTISLDGGTETNTLKDIIKAPYFYVLGNLASPIFEFGRRKANFKASIAAYNQARLNYEKDVLQAFKEVYDAIVSYNSAVEATSLKFDLQEASKQYVSAANLQYIRGVISYIDVLDAQRAYFSSQVELSNAIMDEYKALADLYKALGGGWQDSVDESGAQGQSLESTSAE